MVISIVAQWQGKASKSEVSTSAIFRHLIFALFPFAIFFPSLSRKFLALR
jgi:hypothetical protein